jgi:lactoylglutathione lyase
MNLGDKMRVGYVVLYVKNPDECLSFWTDKVGMVEKGRKHAGDFTNVQIGFADQDFSLELVPLALMANNPHGLDLATPSMAFHVDDLRAAREKLIATGVQATEIGDQGGIDAFAFPDNEGRWFAVLQG